MNKEKIIFSVEEADKEVAQYFTKTPFMGTLINNEDVTVSNVYFPKGCVNNWHSHSKGQIILVTSGEGVHQIRGKEKQIIRPGDVLNVLANTDHYHGATQNSDMSHIIIMIDPKNNISTWKEKVE